MSNYLADFPIGTSYLALDETVAKFRPMECLQKNFF
jgi:hypothetical protein